MKNDFADIRTQLKSFLVRAQHLEHDARIVDKENLRETDFRTKLSHSAPIQYERSYLKALSSPREEAARQRLLVNCCIDQLQTAITLIDAQIVHGIQSPKKIRGLEACYINDVNAFEMLQGRVAGILAGKFAHIGQLATQFAIKPKNFDARMKEIDKDFATLQNGIPSGQMERLRPAQVKQKIFDMRVDFVEAVCRYTDLRLQGAETLMEDAVNLKTALLRGVFKDADIRLVSEQLAGIKAERSDHAAREVRGEVREVNRFLKHLHDMGSDTLEGQKASRVSHYRPATIRGLVAFVA